MKILIVEDDFTARKFIRRILQKHTCDTAKDGTEALEGFRFALDEDKPYDLVFMDLHMPSMNGDEAVKLIRQEEDSRNLPASKKAKVIMTSGEENPAEVYNTFKLGADAYLVKPITRQAVKEWLTKFGMEL